jgi:hypothetical protein
MNVKILKLITGEEIVCEVVSQDDTTVTVKNTVALVLQPNKDGGIQMGFLPWANMVDGDVTIANVNVMYTAEPKDDLKSSYSSMFGGIVTRPKTLITG